jgi:dihydroxyacid dehydratase/phosphogluconate dehydratase
MKIGTNQVLIVQDTGPAGGYGINDKYQQFITILKKDEMMKCSIVT